MTAWQEHERWQAQGRPTERCFTGVRGVFCAAHYSPEGDDHGHDYEAWAYFANDEWLGDARDHKRDWQALLDEFDHKRLPENMAWDTQLAPYLGKRIGAEKVRIIRPLQGIEAWWEA